MKMVVNVASNIVTLQRCSFQITEPALLSARILNCRQNTRQVDTIGFRVNDDHIRPQ
jgi:hypothetical protein